MGIFSKNEYMEVVSKISVFPNAKSVVLKKDDKLIVFCPSYLLGKHGTGSNQVASKFSNLSNATQLLNLIDKNVSSKILNGGKIEIKEIDYGSVVGSDSLVKLPKEMLGILPKEDVRGNMINTLYVMKGRVPTTQLLNIILVPFNPQFGQGVDEMFKAKYNGISFQDFKEVYSIITIFPGKHAPPMDDSSFWNIHALMREI